jgi:MtrB/PioB family decaheme-associated outer membrane protein
LLLAPAGTLAQTPAASTAPATTPPAQSVTAGAVTSGSANFGARGSDVTGDSSRYERYRDLTDGLFLQQLRLDRQTGAWLFGGTIANAGRLDQRYAGTATRPGRFTAWGFWDQIPMSMSRSTRTLFVEDFGASPGVLTIPDNIQALLQPTSAPRVSIFNANSIGFDTKSERRIAQGGFEFFAKPELFVRSTLTHTRREGTLPYGGSFGHGSLVEMPAPIRHSLTDFENSAEFTHRSLLIRGGIAGSWFHNDVTQVEFDNPFQAVDVAGTPARGRLSLAPSNSFISANGMASLRLPRRSRVTAYVSVGSLKDAGADLMPQTINAVNIPTLAALPRTKVNGEARTTGVNLSFTSRPTPLVDFSARYRLYDYDNRTHEFVLPQRVSYDNTPGAATFTTLGALPSPAIVETEPFGVKRQTFDADVRLRPRGIGAAGVGFTRQAEDRSHRFFESTTENIVRVTYDALSNPLFSVRTKYEHGQRRGDVTEEAKIDLFNIGEQPALRQFDIASRDRDRVTILGSIMPSSIFALNASVAAGKDDYVESTFGLRDNTHRVYSAGIDLVPREQINFGVSYSFERYRADLHSRTASPPSAATALTYQQFVVASTQPTPVQQIADSRYDWGSTGTDRVHSTIASLEINKIRNKLDLRFAYDYNRARAQYTYAVDSNISRSLPDDIDPNQSLLPTPTQLPLVRSETQRGTFDAVYALSSKLGLGMSYWYEDYRVSDYTLDVDANPDLVRGSALLLGYLYRPYTARTLWGRLIVNW